MFGFGRKQQLQEELVMTSEPATDAELGVEPEMMIDRWETACAWCLAEQGIVPLSGSHGICLEHRAQVLEGLAVRRRGGASYV